VELKFDVNLKYSSSANMLYKEEREKFGDPSQDAENLRTLCTEIKKAFPDFFNKIQSSFKNSLQSLFFSTSAMRTQYQKYKHLVILDTTFGTNRFHSVFQGFSKICDTVG